MVLERIIAKYPEVKPIAKERQLGSRITGELGKLKDSGVLTLVKEGTSNYPNIFMKTSEWTQLKAEQKETELSEV